MKRIPALDSIRGLLLLLMTINHLFWISGGRSLVQYFTSEPLGPFGPAEGFVFISALLAGAIYSRDAMSNADVRAKAFYRAFTLYRYHIVCLIAVFIWFLASKYAFPEHQHLLAQNFPNLLTAPLETLLFSAALINKPNYFDILPLYIIFMLLLPLLIALYRKGLFWLVIGISLLLWSASGAMYESQLNAVMGSGVFDGFTLHAGYFDPFAWQLLFVVGSAIGFQLQHGNLIRWHHPMLTFLCIAGIGILFAAHHGAFLSMGIHRGIIYDLADKSELGWLRLLTLSMWVYLIALVISKFPNALTFRPLSYIGRHSLHVFAWQTAMIYFAAPLLAEIRFEPFYLAVMLGFVTSLWVPAWIREFTKGRSSTQYWGAAITTGIGGLLALNVSMASTADNSPLMAGNEKFPLTIKLKDVREPQDPVVLMVYSEFDDITAVPSVHWQKYTPEEANKGITLDELAAGKYVVFAFQDRNKDGLITLADNQIPIEGFGYSNNPSLQGPPSKEQVTFTHNKAAMLTIHFNNWY
ncbi:OpgC domain-containing protein [Enterovibrio norvegicus]|uniref:OpgC domain-containing protein n=1 Tax=Enterovibrio norvegicus TaxID=188144 RepID=UPI000C82CD08|nr:OpgC domain-containing protein [Enterovibrio norvegicus]PMI31837.1 hypothetical protein BCU47_14775 [Enterovibrio norvegicus]